MSKQRRPTSSVASGTLQVSPDEAILETHYGRPLPGWVCGAAPWSADLRSPLASRAGSLVQPGLLPLSFLFSPLPPPAPTSLSTSPWIIILLPCNMHLVLQIPGQTDGISRKPFAAPGGLDWGARDAEPQPGDWRRPTPPHEGSPVCRRHSPPAETRSVSLVVVSAPAVGIASGKLLVQATP